MTNVPCRFLVFYALALGVLFGGSTAWATPTVTGMNLVNSTRVGRTTFDYTYTIDVTNDSTALTNATATVTSTAAATVIIQGKVVLGNLAANATTTSTATFTLQQDRTVSFDPTQLHWTFASGPATILLSGDPSSLAVNATVDLAPIPSDPSALTSAGQLLDTIDVDLSPSATVGQINAAIQSVNGSISAMGAGLPSIVIHVPVAPDFATLTQIAQQLALQPGIYGAQPGLPPTPHQILGAPPPPYGGLANIQHLAAGRFPAAFSVLENQAFSKLECKTGPIAVIVDDYFQYDPKIAGSQPVRPDFPARIPPPSFTLAGPNPNRPTESSHGEDMTMVLAATWGLGGGVPTAIVGAAPSCVHIYAFNVGGLPDASKLGLLDEDAEVVGIAQLATSLIVDTGKNVIISRSLGYQLPYGAAYRLRDALQWRQAVRLFAPQIVFFNSAGNDNNQSAPGFQHPGFTEATFQSWATLGASAAPLFNIMQDPNYWGPFLAASATDVQKLQNMYPGSIALSQTAVSVSGLQSFVPPPGVIAPQLDQWLSTVLPDSSFNTLDGQIPGLYAVGDDVADSCFGTALNSFYPAVPCDIASGTSLSTPQVSGLAALLWVVDGALGNTKPLATSSGGTTVNLLTTTAQPLPAISGPTNFAIDALAAVLSLDAPQAPSATSPSVRLYLVDQDQNGTLDNADVQSFVQSYYADPVNFVPKRPKSGDVPDFSRSDLNGDGYTGVWATTTFDLDPTGSAQRGAPLLSVVSQTQPNGRVLHFDEHAVSDLDVMCFYAYSALYTGTDTNGAVRAQLGCDPVTVMAESGDTLSGGTEAGQNVTQTLATIDSKVSVNKAGAIAFAASNVDGTNAGALVSVPHQPFPITTVGASSRTYGGASLNDATPVAQAVFRERVSGAPPLFLLRRWNADGSAKETDIGISITSSSNNDDFASAAFFQDMNDAGVVVFPALDANSQFELLLAGDGSQTNSFFHTHGLQTLIGSSANVTTALLRPQIASTNAIVYRSATGDIVATQYTGPGAAAPTPTTVAAAATFGTLTSRPGISADGNFVAFGSSQGLYVAQAASTSATPPSFGVPISVLTVGGGDPSDPNVSWNSFGVRPSGGSDQARFGIADQPAAIVANKRIEIVFVGSRNYLDPVTRLVTRTVFGVYQLSAFLSSSGYQNVHVKPIVEVNDKLASTPSVAAVDRTVTDFDLWDPISKDGQFAAFWVQFAETGPSGPIQAVLRARLY